MSSGSEHGASPSGAVGFWWPRRSAWWPAAGPSVPTKLVISISTGVVYRRHIVDSSPGPSVTPAASRSVSPSRIGAHAAASPPPPAPPAPFPPAAAPPPTPLVAALPCASAPDEEDPQPAPRIDTSTRTESGRRLQGIMTPRIHVNQRLFDGELPPIAPLVAAKDAQRDGVAEGPAPPVRAPERGPPRGELDSPTLTLEVLEINLHVNGRLVEANMHLGAGDPHYGAAELFAQRLRLG